MTTYDCQGSTVLLGPGIGPLMPPRSTPPVSEPQPFVFFGDECIVRMVAWGGSVVEVKPFVHVGIDVEP